MRIPHDAHLATLLQHFGEEEKPHGAVVPPLYQNSLFTFDDTEELAGHLLGPYTGEPHVYSRNSNPTNAVVEKKMALLEGTEGAKLFSSGITAISMAAMSCLHQGAHVIALDTNYSPTVILFRDYLPRFGVSTTFVDGRCPETVFDAMTPDTKLVMLESPSTAFFRLQDLEAIATECKRRGITTICDNSYATPIFQQPAKWGIDMVVHSASKYLGGHSDITAGVICSSKVRLDKMLMNEGEIPLLSSTLAPFSAWLLNRGMRTLELRVRAHEKTANDVAGWLEEHPKVEVVHHPGLASYPQRDLFRKQMTGSGGLFSFEPKTQDRSAAVKFVNALKLFQRGVSWGGFESLAHAMVLQPMDYKEARHLVRLYTGLEDVQDLIADLEQAFAVSGL